MDGDLIKQVIMNMLVNAQHAKGASAGGKVRLVGRVEVTSADQAHAMADSGHAAAGQGVASRTAPCSSAPGRLPDRRPRRLSHRSMVAFMASSGS